jgi:cyclopropane fatty-acyl-phospholipid synthase-like methyltransferase
MKIGPAIRTRLGRFEIPAADAYRSFFINLEDCAELVSSLWPAKRILEVGCGDGSFGQRLLDRFPDAHYVGIDISENPGRLFRGDESRAEFHSMASSDYLATNPEPFDLVLVVDVLHHVPHELRKPLMDDVRALTVPGGHYAVKDWQPNKTISHYAAYAADRFITGDRIKHIDMQELKGYIAGWLGDELVVEARIPPRRNNYLLGYRR